MDLKALSTAQVKCAFGPSQFFSSAKQQYGFENPEVGGFQGPESENILNLGTEPMGGRKSSRIRHASHLLFVKSLGDYLECVFPEDVGSIHRLTENEAAFMENVAAC
jgi:hypothetical protein